MQAQHERILGIIADLAVDEREVDEFSVAQACGAIPAQLPRHAWMNHPCRADLLHVFNALDRAKLIYVTRRGYWGLHLTKRGRQALEAPAAPEPTRPTLVLTGDEPTPLPVAPQEWAGPRPTPPAFAPRQDHFYSTLALAVVALGALILFAFGQSAYSPLPGRSAAAPETVTAPPTAISLPVLPTATAVPTVKPTAALKARQFAVANTGGDGVFLRSAPQNGARLAAWPERTTLTEIGPEQALGGTTWLHVRAPDGSEGYVPAQYATTIP